MSDPPNRSGTRIPIPSPDHRIGPTTPGGTDTAHPKRGSAPVRLTAVALALLALSACVERGDFGRPARTVWNDAVLGTTGTLAALARGEPTSTFDFTDDETELRARAWRFLTPAHERDYFNRVLAELAAKRVLPPDAAIPEPAAYFDAVSGNGSVSPASRYRRLSEDAVADRRLVEPFVRLAGRVLSADRIRRKTIAFGAPVDPAERADAQARISENRCLLAWVRAVMDARLRGYRFALQHLVVQTPQGEAVPAERAIQTFADELAGTGPLAIPRLGECSGDEEAGAVALPAGGPPLVRKG